MERGEAAMDHSVNPSPPPPLTGGGGGGGGGNLKKGGGGGVDLEKGVVWLHLPTMS